MSPVSRLLFAIGIFAVLAGFFEMATHHSVEAALGLLAGLIFIVASQGDRLESVSWYGFTAKMRRLNETIEHADKVLAQLRRLAELTSASLITVGTRVGKWDSALPASVLGQQVEDVKTILRELQSSDDAIRRSIDPWIEDTSKTMAGFIIMPTVKAVQERIQQLNSLLSAQYALKIESDPELTRIQADINKAEEFMPRLLNFRSFSLSEYPECTLRTVAELREIDSDAYVRLQPTFLAWSSRVIQLKQTAAPFDREKWFKLAPLVERGVPCEAVE